MTARAAHTLAFLFLLPSLGLAASPETTHVFYDDIVDKATFEEVEALGTLQARENVELTATVTDRLVKINFTDNQTVSKGDVLVEMEAAEESALLAEEEARQQEAELQVVRHKKLVKANASTQSILDEKIRDLSASKARIKALQARIDERRILAPFDGVVGIRNISVGALVTPGTLITTLDDMRQMKLDFEVPALMLNSLQKGAEITAKSDAYPTLTFKGKIVSVDSRIDPETRSVMVRALLDNQDKKLKTGMLMTVVLQKNYRKGPSVREEALITRGDKHFVYLLKETEPEKNVGTALLKEVKISRRLKNFVEVTFMGKTQQMPLHSKVILHGGDKIQDGATVTYEKFKR